MTTPISSTLSSFSEATLKLLLEQVEKKYNVILTEDQSLRSRIQSINAISIGIIVLLVGIIHNKEWEDQSMNYFICLVTFLLYNAILFFLTYLLLPKTAEWSVSALINDLKNFKSDKEVLSELYIKRINYYEEWIKKIKRSTKIIRLTFLFMTILFGGIIVGFYYYTYWL